MSSTTWTATATTTFTTSYRFTTWTVTGPDNRVWWPGPEAVAEIEASLDPAATAVRIAKEQPSRGEWVS